MFSDKRKKHSESGFAAFFVTILVLTVMMGVAVSITVLTIGENRTSRNAVKSNQAYYAAEAGIEDALLRLSKGKKWTSPYNLSVDGASASISISSAIGGTRTIVSEGSALNRKRKIEAVYQISTDKVSFYYGAQVGDGGMNMGSGSRVKGNVFSNGSVIAVTGTGYIDDSITVARNGNRIEDLSVGKNAAVHTCKDSAIGSTLTYVSGGSLENCTAGVQIESQPNEILPKDLPIPQSQIDEWKAKAAAGGIRNSDYNLSGNGVVDVLGPVQIGTVEAPKNMTVSNKARLVVTGTIYVTGNILFDNNVVIELDRNAYGSNSGVIVANGSITISNNAIVRGSGEAGSYLLLLSTNNSLDPANPAISIGNNAAGAIFYSNQGLIDISNNVIAREITGYKVRINNNAEVQYESGLQDTSFSSGTGGSWEVVSWKEIE